MFELYLQYVTVFPLFSLSGTYCKCLVILIPRGSFSKRGGRGGEGEREREEDGIINLKNYSDLCLTRGFEYLSGKKLIYFRQGVLVGRSLMRYF